MNQTSRIQLVAVLVPVLLVILACGWFVSESRSPLGWLERFPGLTVERTVRYALPTGLIVHIRDWHTAPDHRDEKHLEEVEAVQAEQGELLRELLKRGYRTVGVEGLTSSGMRAWQVKVEALKEQEGEQANLRAMIARGGDVGREAAKLVLRHRWEVAELGAVAKLLIEGEEVNVFPLDDEEALEAAAPRKLGSKLWEFDAAGVRSRREAIVRNCVATKANTVVIVLGAAHDLSEQVNEVAPGWAYVRATTEAVRRSKPTR